MQKRNWEVLHPQEQLHPLSLQPQKGKNHPKFGVMVYLPGGFIAPMAGALGSSKNCGPIRGSRVLPHPPHRLSLGLKVYPTPGQGWGLCGTGGNAGGLLYNHFKETL